jgi:hypothetical protein
LNHGTLTVSNCLLTGNDAKLFGGAIANPDGGITPPRYAATFSLSSRNKRRLASQKPW